MSTNAFYNTAVLSDFINIFFYIQIDGVFLPKDPKHLLKTGDFNNSIEILMGNNLDEGIRSKIYIFLVTIIWTYT